MNLKAKILSILKQNPQYHSGAELAQQFSVSRTAIWKAVEQLKEDGYPIHAVRNRGYLLKDGGDVVTSDGISAFLKTPCRVIVLPTVNSTNDALKAMAEEGAEEWTLLTAVEQTAGKGRLGRSFYSPAGTGVYLSILLRPALLRPEQAFYITTAAAAAVSRALEDLGCEQAQIKWVNDVYVHGKKVCGILTEGAFDLETGTLRYAVLGIGVNIVEPPGGFGELSDKVGAAFETPVERSRLIASIADHFAEYYAHLESKPHLEEYRQREMLRGKQVLVINRAEERPARVLGLDDEFRLRVEYEDGTTDVLSTGEVSIRPRSL